MECKYYNEITLKVIVKAVYISPNYRKKMENNFLKIYLLPRYLTRPSFVIIIALYN